MLVQIYTHYTTLHDKFCWSLGWSALSFSTAVIMCNWTYNLILIAVSSTFTAISILTLSRSTISITGFFDVRRTVFLRFGLFMRPSSLCTFRHAQRAAYRTAISAAQILVFNRVPFSTFSIAPAWMFTFSYNVAFYINHSMLILFARWQRLFWFVCVPVHVHTMITIQYVDNEMLSPCQVSFR